MSIPLEDLIEGKNYIVDDEPYSTRESFCFISELTDISSRPHILIRKQPYWGGFVLFFKPIDSILNVGHMQYGRCIYILSQCFSDNTRHPFTHVRSLTEVIDRKIMEFSLREEYEKITCQSGMKGHGPADTILSFL